MAVGTVSGLNLDEEWQLITTNTPSAATSSTFSSISGYKKIMIVWKGINLSANDTFMLQFNSDSTSGNYGSTVTMYSNYGARRSDGIQLSGYAGDTTDVTGFVVIKDVLKSSPKIVESSGGLGIASGTGIWISSSAITSVIFKSVSANTFTGTVYLYGIAA